MQQLFGYVRVSTREQNEDRQIIALSEYPIPRENLYIDKQSGKNFNRPAYKKMIRRLKKGDLLLLKSIDRLGRDYMEIIEQWRIITKEKGSDIKVLDMPLLDTTYGKDLLGTFIADLVLQVMSFTAQLERENTLQRQAEGIAAAKARGVQFGRHSKTLPDNFDSLYQLWRDGSINADQLAHRCKMCRSTLFKYIKLNGRGGYGPPPPAESGYLPESERGALPGTLLHGEQGSE